MTVARRGAVPTEAATALHFASLHRKVNAGRTVVAMHQLYACAGDVIEQLRMDRVRRGRPTGAHENF